MTMVRKIFYALCGILIFYTPVQPFGGQEAHDVWQDQYVVPDAKGAFLDAPYIATEYRVVDAMLKPLELKSGDVLYDLGCGDGRIVIEAVKKFGVHGVGIDIDPRRIAESKANAIAAKVNDRTIFLQQDLFESDIREATAVAIFLFPEMNLKLIPKFFHELKPGTRIVSHNFGIGEWKPDREISLRVSIDGFHRVLFWVLPANVSGTWQGRFKQEDWTLQITQKFQNISGRISRNGKDFSPISESTILGDKIYFSFYQENQKQYLTFEGKVAGHTLVGTIREDRAVKGTWKAIRNPATASKIY
jgi:SAM-dependent methyltransferase